MKAFRNLSLLKTRHKAEHAASELPALIASAEKAVKSIMQGEHSQRKSGTGEKFWQFREYDFADRPQDIDWRQSAKGDRLFVREKEWQTTQTAYIWCQNNESMNYASEEKLPTKKEAGQILALAVGILLARAGEQIAPFEGSTLPGRSELATQKLGEHLQDHLTFDLPDFKAVKLPKNSSLVIVGDFLSPIDECKAVFDVLATNVDNAILVQVIDPAELTLPFDGRVIFEQTGQDNRYTIDNVETIRSAYQQRLKDHMAAIKDYCRKHGWHWVLHTTDEEYRQTLFDIWMMMAPDSIHSGGSA